MKAQRLVERVDQGDRATEQLPTTDRRISRLGNRQRPSSIIETQIRLLVHRPLGCDISMDME
jgi:hypothetical protein